MLKFSLVFVLLIGTASSLSADPGWISAASARATSAQVDKLFGPENLTSLTGLTESPPGSGRYQMTTNGYADGGNCWQTGYGPHGPDERPVVEFDLQAVSRVSKLHVWNHNGSPHRGFRRALLLFSRDGKVWETRRQRLDFAMAPRKDDYLGEEVPLDPPVVARYVRMVCLATHRGGGQPDLAGLGKVRFFGEKVTGTAPATIPERPFAARFDIPFDAGWIDVTRPPYSAPNDGRRDATAAIQRAIDDWQGTHAILFLPKGTYLISGTLAYHPGRGTGDNNIYGAGRGVTTLRLANATFTDAAKPKAVLDFAFNGNPDGSGVHADWFNNNIADLTIDAGNGNSGAIGLRYYSNNVGSARRVEIKSGDTPGVIGLDLGYADQNGPCLAQEIDITGFSTGVRTGATVNSQTLEAIRVRGATSVGFENGGQCLALRKLDIESAGPGLHSKFGIVALIDSTFKRTSLKSAAASSSETAAILSHETLFARGISTTGYPTAIANRREKGTPNAIGPSVDEFVSEPVLNPFGGSTQSLRLPVRETPDPKSAPVTDWANVVHFREVTDPDDSAAFARAAKSGASTLYWPTDVAIRLGEPVRLPPTVHRVIGFFGGLHAMAKDRIGFIVEGDSTDPLIFEQIAGHVVIQHSGTRPLVVRDTQGVEGIITGKCDLYLDNVVGEWEFGPGRTWCRQFNTEREGVHAINRGGHLWILGLKTERGGTLVETLPGGKTEIIGGLSYTTTQGGLAPMFTARDAALSVTLGEVCYSGDPFKLLVEQSLGGKTITLKRGEAPLRADFLQGSAIPLYTARP
jgi:hypothetical protein